MELAIIAAKNRRRMNVEVFAIEGKEMPSEALYEPTKCLKLTSSADRRCDIDLKIIYNVTVNYAINWTALRQLQGVGIFLHFHATVIIIHLCGDSLQTASTIERKIPVKTERHDCDSNVMHKFTNSTVRCLRRWNNWLKRCDKADARWWFDGFAINF